jgi:hypothetical protein
VFVSSFVGLSFCALMIFCYFLQFLLLIVSIIILVTIIIITVIFSFPSVNLPSVELFLSFLPIPFQFNSIY